MRPQTTWLPVVAGLAAVFVAVATIVQAVRQGSWTPVVTSGWVPAVIVATWPTAYRRCRIRGRGRAG
jgi:hypothetical protein